MRDKIRNWTFRHLGLKCGELAGMSGVMGRWCQKPFGHIDSCAYDILERQPHWRWRMRAKGWDEF